MNQWVYIFLLCCFYYSLSLSGQSANPPESNQWPANVADQNTAILPVCDAGLASQKTTPRQYMLTEVSLSTGLTIPIVTSDSSEQTFVGGQLLRVTYKRSWESGFELGTGLSFTGYNANFAYAGQLGNNVFFIGPKIVYSDANALFDAPWGLHLGYRRLFPINGRLTAFAALEYQNIFFRFSDLGANDWNAIHELHASYGFQFAFHEHWYIGQSLGLGGYIERLIDPFDQRVDTFNGFSPQARIWIGYIL